MRSWSTRTERSDSRRPRSRAIRTGAGLPRRPDTHPPVRGLLAVPIVGEDGLNYGLLQVSDQVDGTDFDVPILEREAPTAFVRIESG